MEVLWIKHKFHYAIEKKKEIQKRSKQIDCTNYMLSEELSRSKNWFIHNFSLYYLKDTDNGRCHVIYSYVGGRNTVPLTYLV